MEAIIVLKNVNPSTLVSLWRLFDRLEINYHNNQNIISIAEEDMYQLWLWTPISQRDFEVKGLIGKSIIDRKGCYGKSSFSKSFINSTKDDIRTPKISIKFQEPKTVIIHFIRPHGTPLNIKYIVDPGKEGQLEAQISSIFAKVLSIWYQSRDLYPESLKIISKLLKVKQNENNK